MNVYTVKQNKTTKDYFNYNVYFNFVRNNVTNECWFSDRNVLHCYFEDFVTKLVTTTYNDNVKKVQSVL